MGRLTSTRREQPAVPSWGGFRGQQRADSGGTTSASDIVLPPAARLSIKELCRKHQNEDAHTAHVARLALQLLAPDLHILEAARRLITLQFKIVATNVEGALRNENEGPLHDIRVAIRRLRAALRTFHKPLANTSADKLNLALQRLNQALGPARDGDVWIGFLTDTACQRRLNNNRRWATFIRRQIEHRRRQQTTVRRHLSGPSFEALLIKLARLARLEIPRLIKTAPSDNLARFAQRAMGNQLRRALKLAKLRHSDLSAEVHRIRKTLRKARYLGEFFAPTLGPPFDKLTRRIDAAEKALGKIHDTDVGLALALRKGSRPPRLLLRRLAQRRCDHLANVDKEWRRLRQFMSKHEVYDKLKL
jgi:CHAD domain-containing protein